MKKSLRITTLIIAMLLIVLSFASCSSGIVDGVAGITSDDYTYNGEEHTYVTGAIGIRTSYYAWTETLDAVKEMIDNMDDVTMLSKTIRDNDATYDIHINASDFSELCTKLNDLKKVEIEISSTVASTYFDTYEKYGSYEDNITIQFIRTSRNSALTMTESFFDRFIGGIVDSFNNILDVAKIILIFIADQFLFILIVAIIVFVCIKFGVGRKKKKHTVVAPNQTQNFQPTQPNVYQNNMQQNVQPAVDTTPAEQPVNQQETNTSDVKKD